jgi:outer membrane protein assembly factor BamB
MSRHRIFGAATFLFAGLLAHASIAAADCPPDCPVKGGGNASSDCHVELASDSVRLNSPIPKPDAPKPGKKVVCFDGDASCDLDGVANNECEFDVDLCLYNDDPSLADCDPATVTSVTIGGDTEDFPGLLALQTAVTAITPASTSTCTTGQSVIVPLKGPSSSGEYKASKFGFKAESAGGEDSDKYSFVCAPRGWPSHGYDNSNTRASTADTGITPANVSSLVEKWRFSAPGGPNGDPFTSTVTIGPKLVYITGWDGRVYALDKKTGSEKWTFHTHSNGGVGGIQSSVTLTPEGRAIVADSEGVIYCLKAKNGALIWQANAGSADPLAAHAWGSPTVVGDTVVIGIASHNDAPCTRGTLVAYDLDTGAEKWRQHTVPERVCYDDTTNDCSSNAECTTPGSPCLLGRCDSNPDTTCTTDDDCPFTFLTKGTCVAPAPATTGECWLERSITCSSNADCPACIPGVGGGVTATAAASSDGKDIYMASVGCLSRPSIGYSDSMFKLDAETGAIEWAYRTESVEQFQSFPFGPTYHDYGFLNGPILATVGGTTPVAVGGGKDGTLYAVNQETGLLEWSNPLAVAPTFAGFGLFNGALAYDSNTDQFFAALYDTDSWPSSNDHMYAFSGVDGTTAWSEMPGGANQSWSSVTVANGIVYAGQTSNDEVYAFDVSTGTLLHTIPQLSLTDNLMVTGGAALENGVLYVPYGNIFGGSGTQGAIVAYSLPEAP